MSIPFAPAMPSIHPIAMTDWMPKLGQKAFLSWLQLYSLLTDYRSADPFHLPLSLNKIIRKLGVGKSTFYDKVLKPLIQYGLIELKRSVTPNNETHLCIYPYPENSPDKASQPLASPSDIVEEPSPDQKDQCPSIPSNVSLSKDSSHSFTPSQTFEDPSPVERNPFFDQAIPHEPLEPSIHILPEELRHPVEANPKLLERLEQIIIAHRECSKDPRYNHEGFQAKMLHCIRYPHAKNHFASYLIKATRNEWEKPTSPSLPKPKSHPLHHSNPRSKQPNHHPSDLPEWVRQQQEREQQGHPFEPGELTAEQKKIAEELLKQLEEI